MNGGISNLKRLLFCAALVLLGTALEASACARLQRTTEDNFKDLIAVFRGTVTSAEVIQPKFSSSEEAKEAEGIFFVKVRWKVEEIFKGENLEGKSAVTSSFCGAGPIVVGAIYVFAIEKLPEDVLYSSTGNDVIGYLAEASGGFSLQEEMDDFDKVNLQLRTLSKKY